MMQKKVYILFFALFTFFCSNISLAQKGRSEVSVAYGWLSIYSIVNNPPYNVSSGVGMVNYKYYLTNGTTVGGVVGFENISNWGSFLTIAPEFSFTYMDLKDARVRVKLYGTASVGLAIFKDFYQTTGTTIQNTDNSGATITAHASPFGIRVGRRFAAFAELGIGYKGTVNFGLSYRFKTEKKHNYNEN